MPEFDTIKGVTDHFGDEADHRRDIEDTFRTKFRNFGAQEVIPPVLERVELLNSKSSADLRDKGLFYTFTPRSFNTLDEAARHSKSVADLDPSEFLESGLRFDGTVGVARILAQNKDLSIPVKWFYNIPVWRYEDVGRTRKREFWQSGIEYIGTDDLASDAEMISLLQRQFRAVGLSDARILVNNRKLLRGVAEEFGIKEANHQALFRVIDKIGKKDEAALFDEAVSEKGIDREAFEEVLRLLRSIRSFAELSGVCNEFNNNPIAQRGIEELLMVREYLQAFDVAQSVEFSATLARGLDYYTGIIFEGVHDGIDGAIAGGGRYDDLVSDIGGTVTPGVGFAIGTDRVICLLDDMGMIENVETGPQVYVAPMSDDQEVRKYTIRVANKIREQDIKTDIDFSERSIGKKFRRADKNDIPYTVVIGENEVNGNYVKLCDMVTGKDKQFPFSEAGWEIKKKIKRDRKKAKWWE